MGLESKIHRSIPNSFQGSVRSVGRSDVLPRKKSTVSTRSSISSIVMSHSDPARGWMGKISEIELDERGAGGRSDVIPRKKSTVSTQSSITSVHSDAVVEKRGVGKVSEIEPVERGDVLKKQSSVEQGHKIVEAIIEESITEKQQSIKGKPQAVVEKRTESIMKKQQSDEQKQPVVTKWESDTEQSTVEKKVSLKQKQRVAFKQQNVELDDLPESIGESSTYKQQSVKQQQQQQQQHVAKQSTMDKQQSGNLQQHVMGQSGMEKQQGVEHREVSTSVAEQSSMETQQSFKQHVAEQSSAEKQQSVVQKQQVAKSSRSVEVELELAPVKGHVPVQV